MGALMRKNNWAATPLGPPECWPLSLRYAISTMLESRLPTSIAWGREFIQFYNDAYRPILGDQQVTALGARAPDTWSDIWATIGPMWEEVWAGKAIGVDDFKLIIQRNGYPEDGYFNFSYSPVRDDHGDVGGVLVTYAETTRKVLAERDLIEK